MAMRLPRAVRFLVVAAVLMLASYGVYRLSASSLSAPTYLETVQTDMASYSLGETVLVTASGCEPSGAVIVRVTRPDGSVVSDVTNTDESGDLAFTYFPGAQSGRYVLDILGKGHFVLASVTFTTGPAVTTDKGSYQSGETAIISGTHWGPNEIVTLLVHEASPSICPDREFVATADAEGNFEATDLMLESHAVGVAFLVTATGQSSGVVAAAPFATSTIGLVQSKSNGSANNQTSVSATFGSTPASGHLLVAIVGVKANDSINSVSSTSGSWIAAINKSGTLSPTRPGQAIFYRVAGASESATVTASTSPTTIGLQIFEYSGLDPVSPLDGTASNNGPSSVPANTGTVTPISGNTDDLLVAGITINTADSIKAVSNGFTLKFNFVSGSSGGRQTFGSATPSGSAANNNTTFTHGTNSWRAQIVAFKAPPAATPTPTNTPTPTPTGTPLQGTNTPTVTPGGPCNMSEVIGALAGHVPDKVVRLDLNNETIQHAVDTAADTNGDGFVIVLVVKDGTGALGGDTNQRVTISRNDYGAPFQLFGCSVTMHDPNRIDGLPTGWITAGAGGTNTIFIMDLHGADSEVVGWKVEGNGRTVRNTGGSGSFVGIWFAGNNNIMHNSSGSGSGIGLRIDGNGNLATDTGVFSNTSHGVQVTGNNNQLLKIDAGDIGKGNGGDGVNVNGTGNLIQECDAYANSGNGISATGGANTLNSNNGGDIGKGNGLRGIFAGGTGDLTQNTAKGNTSYGFDLTTSGHNLTNNVSGGTGSGEPNGGSPPCQYSVTGNNTNSGGNTSNGVTVVPNPFPLGCTN